MVFTDAAMGMYRLMAHSPTPAMINIKTMLISGIRISCCYLRAGFHCEKQDFFKESSAIGSFNF